MTPFLGKPSPSLNLRPTHRIGVLADSLPRQILLCGLICITASASAATDEKEEINRLNAVCQKLEPQRNQSSYDELVINLLHEVSLTDDPMPMVRDPELGSLLGQLKNPKYLSYALGSVEHDLGYVMDFYSTDKSIDRAYLDKHFRCYSLDAYVNVGSKPNERLKEYFKSLLDKTRDHVNLIAAEKADRDEFEKTTRDQEAAYRKRVLNPKGNSANVAGFQISANSCVVSGKLGLSNPFLEPKLPTGSRFLILDASFKNVATSSRYISPGNLIVSKGGNMYKFDKFNMFPSDGFGVGSDPINPLITYRTKLVYLIPSDLTGKVIWQPDERNDGLTVSCGSI